jgi:hypothetical protein
MPKILIKEIDRTNPGAPGGYENYSVLLAGFMGKGDGKKVQPDTNGVYEFSSAQDFKDTIGLVAPDYEQDGFSICHYGNQMAYELLNMGYPIIYLPVTPETCVKKLTNANTWEIFRDKASYDFRFVNHGFLKSSDNSALNVRIGALHEAIAILNKDVLKKSYEIKSDTELNDETDSRLENNIEANDIYGELFFGTGTTDSKPTWEGDPVLGLKDPKTDKYYPSLLAAVKGVISELSTKTDLLEHCVTTTSVINDANKHIANLAAYITDKNGTVLTNGRGDCIALIELDESSYTKLASADKPEKQIVDAVKVLSSNISGNGDYCALTVPSITYELGVDTEKPNDFNNNETFPGAFHYLACFMKSLRSGFKEWYAAAGYTRGVSNYSVKHTTVTLGEIAINALEPRNKTNESSPMFACNVIANFRGSYYLWGNRTARGLEEAKGTKGDLVASHFLNVRQLCTTLKKQLYVACRRFTFDPNSDTLWFNFVNAIRPTLEEMKADQGIRDYKILKVPTDKKATLKAKIRIIPIEAVEDFDLEISLEDSFGETAVNATESI